MSVSAIIPAAGCGKRFGGTVKKQYNIIDREPLLCHTLRPFLSIDEIDPIIVVLPEEDIAEIKTSVQNSFGTTSRLYFVIGGRERQDSVYNGLLAIRDTEIVLVHDGVRPLVSKELIRECIDATREFGACVPGVRVKDTLKEVRKNSVVKTLNRNDYILTQTPQGFHVRTFKECYEKAQKVGTVFTDDASLVESFGYHVQVITGEESNIKVTNRQDLRIIETLRRVHV